MVADSRMMTAFEYELLPETDAPTELIDGELIVSAEPTPRHQLVASRLQRALGNYAECPKSRRVVSTAQSLGFLHTTCLALICSFLMPIECLNSIKRR